MIYQGVMGPVDLEIERIGNRAKVFPAEGVKLLLIDACNAVLNFFKVAGAQAITVTQPEGPSVNILSSHSRELFDADGRNYKEAVAGATYEISSASQGGR